MKTEVASCSVQPFNQRDLSIVLQGGLSRETLVATAVRCRHWREIFPDAEIILSLSGTDAITGKLVDGVLTGPRVNRLLQTDTHLVGACEAIVESCDIVALSTDGLPLPPIKSDTASPNHINLQIAAAKNGLRQATRNFVLRVRSDLVFLDDGFIRQWQAMAALPRGPRATFLQRVMISWLYTLNPFTLERLPLHFSDWFHFGRLEDVRALWNVPFVSFADAVYFKAHPHPRGASIGERLFNIRIAVEQHLIFHAMRKRVPDLAIEFMIDQSCIDLALDILADDFCLCDLSAAKCVFEKYSAEFISYEKTIHCLTPDDWRLMVDNRGVEYRVTLAHKIREMRDRNAFERDEGFPRSYLASRLFTKAGRHINGEIVAHDRDGVLVFGPHVAMPPGRYRAHVDATTLEGDGILVLRATLDHGDQILAERRIRVRKDVKSDLSLDFDITQPNARDFEVVASMENLRNVAIACVTLIEQGDTPSSTHFPLRLLSLCPDEAITVAGSDAERTWHIVGSSDGLRTGRYSASLNIHAFKGTGVIGIRITAGAESQVLAEQSLSVAEHLRIDASTKFNVEIPKMRPVAIECSASGACEFKVSSVTVIQCPPSDDATYPRFFPASQLRTQEAMLQDDEIVFTRKFGMVSYGPYTSLPPGEYTATFLVSRFVGRGHLSITVTADVGARVLAKKRMELTQQSDMRPHIAFRVSSPGAIEVEVLCSSAGMREVAITGLLIDKLS